MGTRGWKHPVGPQDPAALQLRTAGIPLLDNHMEKEMSREDPEQAARTLCDVPVKEEPELEEHQPQLCKSPKGEHGGHFLSQGSAHRHSYKSRNKEVCTETLEPCETLPRMDKKKVHQHSWKSETGKRQSKSQSKRRNPAGNGPAQATDCESGAGKSENSSEQQRAQTEAQRYTCSEGGKSIVSDSILTTHLRMHASEKTCNDITQPGDTNREKPYACRECGKCFRWPSSLIMHQRIHTGVKPYKCSDCGKCFSQLSNLSTHQRIHTGAKPYKCSECGNCFSESSSLNQHQQIHTGVKPYKCSKCGKCFSRSSTLIRHQQIHTGDKPYKCSECGECFNRSSTLITHQRVHTGVKPYKCSKCGKCFSHSSHLSKHQRIHTGAKPYKCSECGNCFRESSSLNQHQQIHTGVKPYTCSKCGKCFSRSSTLIMHQRIHIAIEKGSNITVLETTVNLEG